MKTKKITAILLILIFLFITVQCANSNNTLNKITETIETAETTEIIEQTKNVYNNNVQQEISFIVDPTLDYTDKDMYGKIRGKYSDWAEYAIYYADKYRYIPDSMLGGDYTRNITREQFCELAYRAINRIVYGKSDEEFYYTPIDVQFKDTDNPMVIIICQMGILNGKNGEIFAPDDPITREEAAVSLLRIAEFAHIPIYTLEVYFDDAQEISDWAKKSVDMMWRYVYTEVDWRDGKQSGVFAPKGYYAREQAFAGFIGLTDTSRLFKDRMKINDGLYYIYDANKMWVEKDRQKVFELPKSKYSDLKFGIKNGQIIIITSKYYNSRSNTSHIFIFDIENGEELDNFKLPGFLSGVTKNKQYIIMEDTRYSGQTVDAAYSVYGVFDFEGNEILPIGKTGQEMVNLGYMENPY